MPTINRTYTDVRLYRDTLTEALQKASVCRTLTMGSIGMNFPTKSISEGEWERVQRMRLEEDEFVKGGQYRNEEYRIKSRAILK